MRPIVLTIVTACTTGSVSSPTLPFTATDVSLSSGFADDTQGHWARGRGCAPIDVDSDGSLDLYIASPGDGGWILTNETTGPGALKFGAGQVLTLSLIHI